MPRKTTNNDGFSLRDINLRLKKPLPPPPPPPLPVTPVRPQWVNRELKHKVWTKLCHMEFVTETSALNHCRDRLPRNLCPHCECLFGAKNLFEETDKAYVYRCAHCGAILTIRKVPSK